MNPKEQQKIISGYLKFYDVGAEYLERLIGAIFKDRYIDIMPGAPGGGPDRSMDIMNVSQNNVLTVWCVTKQRKNPLEKLIDDVLKVLQNFDQWNFSKIETIYLCTCRKITNKKYIDACNKINEEIRNLTEKGVSGLSDIVMQKVDCDKIAEELTTRKSLDNFRKELLRTIGAGIGISLENLLHLGPGVPGVDDSGESLAEMQGEWEGEKGNWSELYKVIIDNYSDIEKAQNDIIIFKAISDIDRLVETTRQKSYDWCQQQLPNIRQKLNDHLWPKMIYSLKHDPLLCKFDIKLAACAIYTNLMLSNCIFSLKLEELDRAHSFIIGNARKGRLINQLIIFKLISLLLGINHRFNRFDKVLELKKLVYVIFFSKDREHNISSEQNELLIKLAWLYIKAVKYGDGDKNYHNELYKSYKEALNTIGGGFWHICLSLMGLLYDRRKTKEWAKTRESFLNGFEKIKLDQINNSKKAAPYLELYARYLELKGTPILDAYKFKLDLLSKLFKHIDTDVRLRLYKLILEQGICYVCTRSELPDRFLSLENSMLKEAGTLGNIWGPIIKTRMLSLFLFRVYDPNIFRNKKFLNESRVLNQLLSEPAVKFLGPYFGIQDLRIRRKPKEKISDFKRIKPAIRPLLSQGLANYTNIILSNKSLPPGILIRACLDYIDFLSRAKPRYSDIRISMVFWELIDFLEKKAHEISIFHYYLARIYYKHALRDIPKTLEHFNRFWRTANDFEKNRFAGEYARILYEHHMYYDRENGEEASLKKLVQIGSEFQDVPAKQHFISCYYGLALILSDSERSGLPESEFIDALMQRIVNLGGKYSPDEQNYLQNLIESTVYTTEFHDFLRTNDSYIAYSLVASLDSPEIYNAIATYLLNTSRPNLSHEKLAPVKLLYDIAFGLAHSQEYYLPKYEFNRIRCDFFEIEASSPLNSQSDVDRLVSLIDRLHQLGPKFTWVYSFLKNEIYNYFQKYKGHPMIQKLLSHEHFFSRWGVLRGEWQKKQNYLMNDGAN